MAKFGPRRRELHGLTIPQLHPKLKHIELRVWHYVYSVRDATCRKHEKQSWEELTVPQNSAIETTAQLYLKELMLQTQLEGMTPDNLDFKLFDLIVKASRERHTALLKLGLSEKDTGIDFLQFGDDEEEENRDEI